MNTGFVYSVCVYSLMPISHKNTSIRDLSIFFVFIKNKNFVFFVQKKCDVFLNTIPLLFL